MQIAEAIAVCRGLLQTAPLATLNLTTTEERGKNHHDQPNK